MISRQPIQFSPFKGLVPYTEADAQYFFGREGIRDNIIGSLQAYRLTLLYGASGVGKSSLLHAAVVPYARKMAQQSMVDSGLSQPEFSIITFNAWRDDPIAGLARAIHANLADFLNAPPRLPVQATLTAALNQWKNETQSELYIILDQFEEYFQYHAGDQGPLATQLPLAVSQSQQRIKFLISIREDAVAKLDLFKGRIPNLFNHIERVRPLSLDEARTAIEGPIQRYNAESPVSVSIEPELLNKVLENVKRVDILTDRGGMAPGQEHVDAAILQQVMSKLWEEDIGRIGGRVLRLSTFNGLGGAKKIVSNHFSSTMEKLTLQDREIAAAIFRYLVTPSGTKIAQTAADLAAYSEQPDEAVSSVVKELSRKDIRILRTISPPPNQDGGKCEERYEIFHDVLSGPINEWWRNYEADARATRDALRERAKVRVKFARMAFAALAVILVGVSLLTVYAFRQKASAANWARREKEAAEKERIAKAAEVYHKEGAFREAKRAQDAEEFAKEQAKKAQAAEIAATRAKNEALTARDLANKRTQAMIAARKTDLLYRQAYRQSRRTEQREQAIKNFEEALKVYTNSKEEVDYQAATETYLNMGGVYLDDVKEDPAARSFQHALLRTRNPPERAWVLTNIADAYKEVYPWSFGAEVDPTRIATDRYSQALTIYQQLNDANNQADVLLRLAVLKYQETNDFRGGNSRTDREEAFKLIEAARNLYEQANNPGGQGNALLTRAKMETPPQAYIPAELASALIYKYQEALNQFQRAKDVTRQIEIHNKLVQLFEAAGQIDASRAHLAMISTLYTDRKDDSALTATRAATAVFNLKHTPPTSEDFVKYIADYKEAAKLYEKGGRLDKAAFAWKRMGTDYYPKAKLTSDAKKALEKAAELFGRNQDYQRQISTLYELAKTSSQTDKTQTLCYLDEIVAIVDRLQGREKAPGLLYLGSGYLAVDKSIQASKHFEDALALYKDPQDLANQRATLERISGEYLGRSMVDDGINILNRLLQSYKGNAVGEAKTHMSLAAAYAKQNKAETAVENYTRAAKLYADEHYFFEQVRGLFEIGKIRYDGARFDQAITVLEDARNILKRRPYLSNTPEVLMLLAQSYGANKQDQKALSLYEEAANAYNANSRRQDEAKALKAISEIYEAQGDAKNAQLYKERAEQAAKPMPGGPQQGPPGP